MLDVEGALVFRTLRAHVLWCQALIDMGFHQLPVLQCLMSAFAAVHACCAVFFRGTLNTMHVSLPQVQF